MAVTSPKFTSIHIVSLSILIVSSTCITPEILEKDEGLQQPRTHLQNHIPNSNIDTSRDLKSYKKASEQKRGRRLRNYSEIPKSNRLDSDVEFMQDSSMTFWCSLPKNSKEKIKECYINSPDGSQYLKTDKNFNTFKESYNTTEWVDSVNSNIIIIMPKDKKQCKAVINNVKNKDVGKWSCKIHLSASNQFQTATQTVSARDENYSSFLPVRDVRLPTSVTPEKYNIYLTPFIVKDNYTIEGHVDITVKILEPTSRITLHIRDIQIYENLVQVENRNVVGHGYDAQREFYLIYVDKELETGSTVDAQREFYIIYVDKELETGSTVKVSISFLANLNDDLSGFYRSSYHDQQTNTTKFMAVSDFEAPDARRAFPCFDEPDKKAIFQVNLGRTNDMSSISNMPQILTGVSMDDNDEYVWDVYEDSVKMSTYLVAFVVSEFEYRESALDDNNVRFRIWCRKDAIEQTEYAADIGPRILKYYESYFGVPYPLPKQDMIAIPDFSAGAMENWGLITYRETALLYEEGVTSSYGQERVRTVIAHELAHQWFGNLVTMEWWTDLWLNEGFASYVEYLGAEHVAPSSGIMDRFSLREVQRTFPYDSLQSSHPVSVEVHHPDEIGQIFDSISYGKGASIIRMMANFLGIETFNQGITNYLRKHEYGNARQDDLWQSLTDIAIRNKILNQNLNVKEIMDTWTLQMGYPIVKVERDYKTNKLRLTQERFLMFRDAILKDEHLYRWWIPISCTQSDATYFSTDTEFWMSPKSPNHTTSAYCNTPMDKALMINVQQTGYYRVNYDDNNWRLIISALNKNITSIHRSNRAQLIDDAMNLARAGYLKYEIALQLIDYLERDVEYIPWKSGLSNFKFIRKMMKRTGSYGLYKEYIKTKIEPIFNKLFNSKLLETNDVMNEMLLVDLVKEACELDSIFCEEKLSEATRSMERINRHQDHSSTQLKGISLCQSVREGDEKRWDNVWKMYTESSNVSLKRRLLRALGCTKQIWILKRYLEMSIDPLSGIRKQDGTTVITSVATNSIGRDLTWNWLRNDWDRISTYYNPNSSKTIRRIIKSIASDFNTPLKLRELEDFYEEHESELGGAKRDILSSIQNVKANVNWMKKNYGKVSKWLQTKVKI